MIENDDDPGSLRDALVLTGIILVLILAAALVGVLISAGLGTLDP